MSADSITPECTCLRRGRRCLQWALLMLIACGAATIVGCQSMGGLSARNEHASIDGVMGPTERKLKQASWDKEQRAAAASGDIERIGGLAEYRAAEKMFQAGRYGEAEKAFKRLVKSRRNGGLSFSERAAEMFRSGVSDSDTGEFGDPVEEDALFMVAESQFLQKKYSWAQDSYDKLLERYPSSRHLDQVTHRLFNIAQAWMGFPEINEDDNIVLASAELQDTNPRTGDRSFKRPGFFNVTDRTRPVFDTSGRALQALQSIWLNDANGPLADDALMLTANYHLQTGNYIEAARVYQLLREQYPDSPHFQDAFLLDSHVRLASYEGPGYDDRALQESRSLRETAQRLFPNLSPEQRARLDDELERIQRSEVAREWHIVEFYQSKGRGYETSVALQCNLILNQYPDSPYADRARKALQAVAAETRRPPQWNPLAFLTGPPPSFDSPVLAGIAPPSPQTLQTARRETPPVNVQVSAPKEEPAATARTRKPGYTGRFPKPLRQTPRLRPTNPNTSSPSRADSEIRTLEATTPQRSSF